MENYLAQSPENTILLTQAMRAIEREGELLESQENEKFLSAGLQMPLLSSRGGPNTHFSHSSLCKDMTIEFKDAKWVVLTSPKIKNRSSKN